jgi:hypothetical protein
MQVNKQFYEELYTVTVRVTIRIICVNDLCHLLDMTTFRREFNFLLWVSRFKLWRESVGREDR